MSRRAGLKEQGCVGGGVGGGQGAGMSRVVGWSGWTRSPTMRGGARQE